METLQIESLSTATYLFRVYAGDYCTEHDAEGGGNRDEQLHVRVVFGEEGGPSPPAGILFSMDEIGKKSGSFRDGQR
jgi:hypothetical protein